MVLASQEPTGLEGIFWPGMKGLPVKDLVELGEVPVEGFKEDCHSIWVLIVNDVSY